MGNLELCSLRERGFALKKKIGQLAHLALSLCVSFSVVLFLLDNIEHKQKTQKTMLPSGINFVWKFSLLLTSLHDNESPMISTA